MKTIDTRELAKRLEELRDLQRAIDDAREELDTLRIDVQMAREAEEDCERLDAGSAEDLENAVPDAEAALEAAEAGMDDEDREELKELEELESEISEWRHGETLILESDFEDYARELADDCYNIPDTWPHRCIDWTQAAEELAYDYTLVSYRGDSYYVRA